MYQNLDNVVERPVTVIKGVSDSSKRLTKIFFFFFFKQLRCHGFCVHLYHLYHLCSCRNSENILRLLENSLNMHCSLYSTVILVLLKQRNDCRVKVLTFTFMLVFFDQKYFTALYQVNSITRHLKLPKMRTSVHQIPFGKKFHSEQVGWFMPIFTAFMTTLVPTVSCWLV